MRQAAPRVGRVDVRPGGVEGRGRRAEDAVGEDLVARDRRRGRAGRILVPDEGDLAGGDARVPRAVGAGQAALADGQGRRVVLGEVGGREEEPVGVVVGVNDPGEGRAAVGRADDPDVAARQDRVVGPRRPRPRRPGGVDAGPGPGGRVEGVGVGQGLAAAGVGEAVEVGVDGQGGRGGQVQDVGPLVEDRVAVGAQALGRRRPAAEVELPQHDVARGQPDVVLGVEQVDVVVAVEPDAGVGREVERQDRVVARVGVVEVLPLRAEEGPVRPAVGREGPLDDRLEGPLRRPAELAGEVAGPDGHELLRVRRVDDHRRRALVAPEVEHRRQRPGLDDRCRQGRHQGALFQPLQRQASQPALAHGRGPLGAIPRSVGRGGGLRGCRSHEVLTIVEQRRGMARGLESARSAVEIG